MHLQYPSTGHGYVETLTKKQHTENSLLVCGNTDNTNNTPTRSENGSIVCRNTSNTLTKPQHMPLVGGNTIIKYISNTPKIV